MPDAIVHVTANLRASGINIAGTSLTNKDQIHEA